MSLKITLCDDFSGEQRKLLEEKSLQSFLSLKDKTCKGSEWTGWFNWPKEQGFKLIEQLKEALLEVDIYYDVVCVVGIGGSFCGTRAVCQALEHTHKGYLGKSAQSSQLPIVYLGQNLSEATTLETLELLDKKSPLCIVISKSGSTIEPALSFRFVRKQLEDRYGKEEARQRLLMVTGENSGSLRELAKKNNYQTFPVPDSIGGRYSVLSAVGILPLLAARYDVEALMLGANECFKELLSQDLTQETTHVALSYAAWRHWLWEKKKVGEVLAYETPKLAGFMEWWRQLFAESEGKNSKGLLPVGMLYSTDLHSVGQFLQDGPLCFAETFLVFKDMMPSSLVESRLKVPYLPNHQDGMDLASGWYLDDINRLATSAGEYAHKSRGVFCSRLELPKLNEYYLGYLFSFFQVSCAVSALLLDVNPFDQPGVEKYKQKLWASLKEGR